MRACESFHTTANLSEIWKRLELHSLWDGWTIYIQAQYFEGGQKGEKNSAFIYQSSLHKELKKERGKKPSTMVTKRNTVVHSLDYVLCPWKGFMHGGLVWTRQDTFLYACPPLIISSLFFIFHCCWASMHALDTLESIVLQAKVRFLVRGND